jgi:TolA-binding protein
MKIAREADERDVDAKARAYNAIGDSLLAKNRTREALLAYLRVRVLYFKAVDEMPHALYGSARSFTILKQSNEAREVVSLMEKEYPNSVWTAKAKKDLGG